MLHYLQHHEINQEKWNACIAASAERKIYAFAWYLDVVCEQQWSALVEIQHEKYVAVLPLPEKKRAGIYLIYQPFFTQQLGVYQTSSSKQPSEAFFNQIPEKYRKIYLQLNTSNILQPGNLTFKWNATERPDYLLSLNKPYPELFKSYATNQKRNLKKAVALGVHLEEGLSINPLIKLFKEEKGAELPEVKDKHYKILAKLYTVLKEQNAARILEVKLNNELLAAALITIQPNEFIYLFGSASEKGKKNGAMAFLIDYLIQEKAGSESILDFEGSTVAGVAKFYANFGAEKATYLSLQRDNLPWYLKWMSR